MKAMCCSRAGLVTILSALLMLGCVLTSIPAPTEEPKTARALQRPGDPVAVIGWLPDVVSNGTGWYNLDGTDSWDTSPGGTIVNYTWQIVVQNTTTYLFASATVYKFRTLGLYKITLTVTDNEGNTATAFAAVYSVPDSDSDFLPDWWEDANFNGLQEAGSGDYDHDGYTNLEEYASGKDPTAKDPKPGLLTYLMDNWIYLAIIAAIIAAAIAVLLPRSRRKRKEEEKKKIEAAIEIEKALEGEK
ncbi:MAG: PKD domain-containing protein [Thermoplasmata archaeon]